MHPDAPGGNEEIRTGLSDHLFQQKAMDSICSLAAARRGERPSLSPSGGIG